MLSVLLTVIMFNTGVYFLPVFIITWILDTFLFAMVVRIYKNAVENIKSVTNKAKRQIKKEPCICHYQKSMHIMHKNHSPISFLTGE